MSNKGQIDKWNFQILLWENLEKYHFCCLAFILFIFNDRHKCYKMSKNCKKKGHFITVIISRKIWQNGYQISFLYPKMSEMDNFSTTFDKHNIILLSFWDYWFAWLSKKNFVWMGMSGKMKF